MDGWMDGSSRSKRSILMFYLMSLFCQRIVLNRHNRTEHLSHDESSEKFIYFNQHFMQFFILTVSLLTPLFIIALFVIFFPSHHSEIINFLFFSSLVLSLMVWHQLIVTCIFFSVSSFERIFTTGATTTNRRYYLDTLFSLFFSLIASPFYFSRQKLLFLLFRIGFGLSIPMA